MTKSPLGGGKTGQNPTDRAKSGAKRSLLVDECGAPLGLVVSGVNTTGGKLLEATLASMPIERPDPQATPQNLSLDKGYSGTPNAALAQAYGYEIHVPDKANTKNQELKTGRRKARRWVVEIAHTGMNRFSADIGSLGEEGEQLLEIGLLRLRHHVLAQMRGLEIHS